MYDTLYEKCLMFLFKLELEFSWSFEHLLKNWQKLEGIEDERKKIENFDNLSNVSIFFHRDKNLLNYEPWVYRSIKA